MRTTRTLVPILVALVAGLPGAPAPASTPPSGAALAGGALETIAEARRTLSGGRIADAVAAAAGLGSLRPATATARPAPVPAGIPAEIAEPVGRLLGAVRQGRELIASALRVSPAELERLSAEADAAIRRHTPEPGAAIDPAAVRARDAASRRAMAAVDRDLVAQAGMAVTTAIDAALPALDAYATALGPKRAAQAGCEILDQGPLCIAGTGANTITGDRALLIDLGGDDVHTHAAGGGWLGNPISISIDLAGNDVYSTPVPSAQGAFTAHGSGVLGVGVLVDAAGDDRYTATGAPTAGSVYAQGVGGGAGVGVLADLAGNDRYEATARRTSGMASIGAQGYGDTGGIGVAIDLSGNDSYLIEATTCAGCGVEPRGFAYAEIGGVALSYDGGGTDTMSLRALGAQVAPDDPNPPNAGGEINPWGYGFSLLAGAALHVTGDGPTTRTLLGQGGSSQAAGIEVRGFGHTDRGVIGAVADAGGDDVYDADALSHYVRTLRIEDGCECPGVLAQARTDQASVIGMGFGQLGGVAMVLDGAGNDRYLSEGRSHAEAEAHDARTVPPTEGDDVGAIAEAVNEYSNFSIVQGVSWTQGAGFLIDRAGDDLYESKAGAQVRALATAVLEGTPTSATATTAGGWSTAQGQGSLGYGELRDLGGADTYVSVATSAATAQPATTVTAGNPSSQVQGDGTGWLYDLGSGTDTFSSTPANPACTGTRGTGLWLDCGNTGGGFNQ